MAKYVKYVGSTHVMHADDMPLVKANKPFPLKVRDQITGTQLKRISHDERFEELEEKDEVIYITNPKYQNSGTKKGNTKTIDGIFSPLFGEDFDKESYSCPCHTLAGLNNKGKICPNCQKPVKEVKTDLSAMGYIDISPYHILTMHGYYIMRKYVKNLNKILTQVSGIDITGRLKKDGPPDGLGYIDGRISLTTLYETYDEDFFPLTGIEKKYIFMSKIPVLSPKLRPLIEHSESRLSLLPINKAYLSILKLRENLFQGTISGSSELMVERNLNEIQTIWLGCVPYPDADRRGKTDRYIPGICMDIHSKTLSGKTGKLRQIMASGRIDNSSRLVIALGGDLKAHEVMLPYHTLVTFLEGRIVNKLCIHDDINVAKATNIVRRKRKNRDPIIMKIINSILHEGVGVWGLVNRNPTILEEGMQYMRVKGISDEFLAPGQYDETMKIPPDGLVPFNADFDGDQMTFALMHERDHAYLLPLCPTYYLVNRIDGKFDRTMGFNRDYAAILTMLWDMGVACKNFAENPCDDTYDTLTNYRISNPYLAEFDNENYVKKDKTSGKYIDVILKNEVGNS